MLAAALSTHSEVTALSGLANSMFVRNMRKASRWAMETLPRWSHPAAVRQRRGRQSKILLNVFNLLDAGIEEFDEERQSDAQYQAATQPSPCC